MHNFHPETSKPAESLSMAVVKRISPGISLIAFAEVFTHRRLRIAALRRETARNKFEKKL